MPYQQNKRWRAGYYLKKAGLADIVAAESGRSERPLSFFGSVEKETGSGKQKCCLLHLCRLSLPDQLYCMHALLFFLEYDLAQK